MCCVSLKLTQFCSQRTLCNTMLGKQCLEFVFLTLLAWFSTLQLLKDLFILKTYPYSTLQDQGKIFNQKLVF